MAPKRRLSPGNSNNSSDSEFNKFMDRLEEQEQQHSHTSSSDTPLSPDYDSEGCSTDTSDSKEESWKFRAMPQRRAPRRRAKKHIQLPLPKILFEEDPVQPSIPPPSPSVPVPEDPLPTLQKNYADLKIRVDALEAEIKGLQAFAQHLAAELEIIKHQCNTMPDGSHKPSDSPHQ